MSETAQEVTSQPELAPGGVVRAPGGDGAAIPR